MTEPAHPSTKAELLDAIRCQREALEDVVAGLSREQMAAAGVINGWTVKDLLAHIVAWEQRMVHWVGQYLAGGVPDLPGDWDDINRLNAISYKENKDRSLDDVLEGFGKSYPLALQTAEATSEADLLDPERFPARGGRPLWIMVAANTFWHYQEHREQITGWVEETYGPHT